MNDLPGFVRNEKGIALLVTLMVTTVLIALTMTLFNKMNSAFDASVEGRKQTIMTQMTSSGVHLAMAMLVKDKRETKIDSVQEDWADPEKVAEAMSDIVFDNGGVSVTISDERSRVQVNALVMLPGHDFNPIQFLLWDRLLGILVDQYEPLQDLDYMVLINSLKDWIDDNDDEAITGLSGAESSYYMDLDPSYECRNAPLAHIGELTRIKGFPPELFSGNADMPDVSDYLTVYGAAPIQTRGYGFDGKININTAETVVLAAILPEGYEIYAQEIFNYRLVRVDETYVNNLSSSTWYRNVPGLEDLEIDEGLITTSSNIFRISATATLDEAVLTTTAVVLRETAEKTRKWRCKVLYWENK